MLIYFVDGGFIRSNSTEALFIMDNTTEFPVTKSFGSFYGSSGIKLHPDCQCDHQGYFCQMISADGVKRKL